MTLKPLIPCDDYITTTQAAELLDIPPDAIYRLLEEGRIRAFRTHPRAWWKIERASVIEYVAEIARIYGVKVKPDWKPVQVKAAAASQQR